MVFLLFLELQKSLLVPKFSDAMHDQYTKHGRWTYFGRWSPSLPEQRFHEYQYTKLGWWTYFGWLDPIVLRAEMQWIPVHKAWQMNLAWSMCSYHATRAEMPCIPVHKTWQMNLLWQMDPLEHSGRDGLNSSSIHHLADEPTLADAFSQEIKNR